MRFEIAVITIQYWARDCLSRRHIMAMQRFAMRKFLARETIGFFILRRLILPLRQHHNSKHRAVSRQREEMRREKERKRLESERLVEERRQKKEKEAQEAKRAAEVEEERKTESGECVLM